MRNKIYVPAVIAVLCVSSLFANDGISNLKNKQVNDQSIFQLSPAIDGPLLGGIAVLNGSVLYLDKIKEINRMEFDGDDFCSSEVNGFDRMALCPYSKGLDVIGDGLMITSCLTPGFLLLGTGNSGMSLSTSEKITIGTMYTETMLLAYGLKELGKLCVNRPRPYMYDSDYPTSAIDDGDWCKSFPSGHTTLAFAGATFTSYVFFTMFPDSAMKVPVITASYSLALATAIFRVASGNHFMTDALAGAAIGTVCGFVVPYIHTRMFNFHKSDTKTAEKVSFALIPWQMSVCLHF